MDTFAWKLSTDVSGKSIDPAKEKINKSLTKLAVGQGYSEQRLFDCSILELLPEEWPSPMQIASCDELIRTCISQIENPLHRGVIETAFGLTDDHKCPTEHERLASFARDWREKHPDPKHTTDMTDYKKAVEVGRRLWREAKGNLLRQIYHEIVRRDRIGGWSQPGQPALERFEAVLHPDKPPDTDQPPQVVEPETLPPEPPPQDQIADEPVANETASDMQQASVSPPPRKVPSSPRRPTLRMRAITEVVLWLIVGVVGWVVPSTRHQATVLYYELTGAASCSDVGSSRPGTPNTTWSEPFQMAYQQAGGKAAIGCPRTDDPSGYVHQWGAGVSQDFQGGKAGIARIMALDPQHVVIVAGKYWHDYTDTTNGRPDPNAAQEKGYPTSAPVTCGRGRLVMLGESQQGMSPGAMVTNPQGTHFIWLPKAIWSRYAAIGGPYGRLGLPVEPWAGTQTGSVQRFEHGSITIGAHGAQTDLELDGQKEPVNPKAVTALQACLIHSERLLLHCLKYRIELLGIQAGRPPS